MQGEGKRRFIEVEGAFPLEAVSRESRREKSIRHGHISTLHIWWARRPLAASRAAIFAALVPDPVDERKRRELARLIERMAPWEAVSRRESEPIREARRRVREAWGGKAPKLLDCFAGGGSIPLEALRLGCETYALEYNPVAVLILKAVLEFPQKFGRGKEARRGEGRLIATEGAEGNALAEAVRFWGNWVLEEARRELQEFYPTGENGVVPVGYIWARTLPCQDPKCGAEIPLMRQTWLAKREGRKVAIKLVPDRERKRVDAVIVKGSQIDFDPSRGTVKGAVVTCPICGGTIEAKKVRELFRQGKAGQRLMAVVWHRPGQQGKFYSLPREEDVEACHRAEEALKAKIQALRQKWGMEPVPNEPTPLGGGPGAERALSMRVHKYGMTTWGDLFNSRQKLALLTFADKVREAHGRVLEETGDTDFAKAVATYLAFALDRLANRCSSLCRWHVTEEALNWTFVCQALSMVWDYCEGNPFSEATGSWKGAVNWIAEVIEHCSKIENSSTSSIGSATKLPYPDRYFDAVVTDPPYYDNIAYGNLSDFFYVWLKRTVGDLYPELFGTPLTPKAEELVADTARRGGSMEEARKWFEEGLTQSFREICRVLKDDGIAVIVFAHTSVEAWESVIKALLDSGLYLTASLPIQTESPSREHKSAALLASSVWMVCRKRLSTKEGCYRQVLDEMRQRIPDSLERFWEAGISGADFFQSAIGPAVAVFGRFERIVRGDGREAEVGELLEEARKIVAESVLRRTFEKIGAGAEAIGVLDPTTRFYILWRWTFGGGKVKVPFDDALRLARSEGVELRGLAQRRTGLVRISGDEVRVLGPQDREGDRRFLEQDRFDSLIDAIHRAAIAWRQGDKAVLDAILSTNGSRQVFWWVAQAVAEVLPQGDEERRLLHAFLQTRHQRPLPSAQQETLFE